MLLLNAGPFAQVLTYLGSMQVMTGQIKTNPNIIAVDAHAGLHGIILHTFTEMRQHCATLELSISISAIDNLIEYLGKKQINFFATTNDLLMYITRLIPDELKSRMILVLDYAEAQLYGTTDAFGVDVVTKFPSAKYEIDESAKCLALSRSTASAFHSIRCLEAGIRGMSRCLGIKDPTKAADRSWFKLLKAIKAELDNKWPTSNDKASGDGRFFEEAYAVLAAMQNPYRNATMHLDQKYTEAEAKHIFEMVKGFMVKLAARCDEDGSPKSLG